MDDNVNLCKTMAFILKRKGYNVATASDGMEALKMAKDNTFNLIFIDIKMPIMNGVETYKKIKKIRPEAVVIMMTAYSVEELIQEALEEGAYGILHKPIDPEKVISLIKKVKEKKNGGFVMIVDDDLNFSISLKNILTKRSYLVGIAHTGEKAINMARKDNYDVILIDIKLPSINGLETYLEIKKANSNVVVIMMTGYRQEVTELVEEALKNNAYTCLYKPLDMEILLKIIDNILKSKNS